ncbi:MAG: HlyD family efflux transporter periplasmic adaptor subunit [Bacteroidota bacterium]
MRKFAYNKQKAIIRTLKEPPPLKKKINWDRIIFIGAIILVVFFVSRHFFLKLAFIQADGQVFMENLDIQFTDDVRVRNLHFMEGDLIKKGDTLFTYTDRLFDSNGSYQVNSVGQRDWILREKLQVQARVEMIKHELAILSETLEEQRNIKKATAQQVVLDITPLVKYQETTSLERNTQNRIDLLNREFSASKRQLAKLELLESRFVDPNTGQFSSNVSQVQYTSPINGIVGRIDTEPNEVCYEGENVMVIHRADKISIKAYFSQKYIDEISEGDFVMVKFPDGSRGKGRIKQFSIATFALPAEFQKKYEPTERSILAEIIPVESDDLRSWRKFFKMDVVVRKRRF